ncbi:MAG: oxygen-binding di-iron domain-containing protein [Bdellovibrionota bacterium]
MLRKTLFDDGIHEWIAFARDPNKPDSVIDTNEYLIVNSGTAMLLDPGGAEIFPVVLSEISKAIDIQKITQFLCSHQDPDIMSSLPLWMALNPKASIYVSWLWSKFISHFGNSYVDRFIEVPDEGMRLMVGNQELTLVPAHYLHSSGNFNLYDPRAKILFSGDIGAALLPAEHPLFVEDFEAHIPFIEGFHRRWMPSNEAKNRWIRRVRRLDVEMICPQHGAIFKGKNVSRFLDWFEELEVGKTKE